MLPVGASTIHALAPITACAVLGKSKEPTRGDSTSCAVLLDGGLTCFFLYFAFMR
jgi:hypothetical protein